jgi:hypothetical protein
MKILIPAYSLDDAAKRLSEEGFKLDVTELLGLAAAQEFPVNVNLPAPFYKWAKSKRPFTEVPQPCTEIPDFFPTGFDHGIAPIHVLAFLTYRRSTELSELYTFRETPPPDLWKDYLVKYVAVPPYTDNSKPYAQISRDNLFIQSAFLSLLLERLSEKSCDSGDEGRRNKQIAMMLDVAKELGYQPLSIPCGGKAKMKKLCCEIAPRLFTETGFDHAWKEAKGQIGIENPDRFKPR